MPSVQWFVFYTLTCVAFLIRLGVDEEHAFALIMSGTCFPDAY